MLKNQSEQRIYKTIRKCDFGKEPDILIQKIIARMKKNVIKSVPFVFLSAFFLRTKNLSFSFNLDIVLNSPNVEFYESHKK